MNYTKKSFTVAGRATQQYADNWERTFGKCSTCGMTREQQREKPLSFCSNSFHAPPAETEPEKVVDP